jgi:ribose transport system ATP-binding protein
MVEVAKALKVDARLVVMDEPTSALSQRERDQLFRTVRRLSERGISVLYISHRIEEVYALAKRAVVLRDGELVGDLRLDETNESQLIALMVGRAIENVFPYEETGRGGVVLAADRLADGRVLHSASIEVREGEIVALVGLMGSGRSELLRCLGGIQRPTEGAIEVRGEPVGTLTPARASRLGIGFVPEDRHAGGVVDQMTVGANLSLAWLRRACSRGLVRLRAERRLVESLIERLGVRPPDRRRRVALLSGGNQQKLVIGKTLSTEPRILLLDEPTRGVDVGAKAEIHARICELKADGVAVLMATSELPEALGVADRVVVLNEGRTVATLPRGTTETEVMNYAFGRATVPSATDPQVRG